MMKQWYESSVFYHLYPLGCTGAPDFNHGEAASRFDQLNAWIPYISGMGFNALYIGPLFESSSHGYDTRDYRKVDCRLGTNEEFRDFVAACHSAGIRVVIDAVFNHTGREFFAFRDIQEKKWDSPYKDWYRGVSFHCSSPMGDPFCYDAWQGQFQLPCLNLKNPEVKQYIFDTVRFWVDTFGIDGLRLDCAGDLDFDFMKELRRATAPMKEAFWLMGEVIHGEYGRWVNDEMLQSVTNYALLFTLPGIPSIYYGSEWGMEGKRTSHSDKALRPAVTAEEAESRENGLKDLIRKLIRIHRENPEFHGGLYQELYLTNRQFAFARYGSESIIITAVNCDSSPSAFVLPLPICSRKAENLMTGEEFPVEHDVLPVRLEANSAAVIKLWDALMEDGKPLDEGDMDPEELKELLGDQWEE